MFPDELSKKENLAQPPQSKKLEKSDALKKTIQKIVKANNEFHHQQNQMLIQPLQEKLDREPIDISPKEIVFEAVSIGVDYFTTLVVTNLTAKQKKIKIKQPKNSAFTFENSESALIAPGLQFQCRIFYKARTLDEIHDNFTVISDDYSLKVPISVFPPRGILEFDPFVNLGFVQLETAVSFKIQFSNVGQEPITVEFTAGDEFSLISNSFPMIIQKQSSGIAVFEAIFSRTGVFRSSVAFLIQGHLKKYFLELSATVVTYCNFLVDDKGNEISVLNFEEILLGDERTKKVTLINNSPKPAQFRIQILKGINNEHFTEQAKPQTPFDLGLELSEQVIFCEPSSGVVESYGYQILNFKLKTHPTTEEKLIVSKFAIFDDTGDQEHFSQKGKRSFNYTAFVNFEDQNTQKMLQIYANAYCPLINFSHQSVRFGELVVGMRKKFEIILSNYLTSAKSKT